MTEPHDQGYARPPGYEMPPPAQPYEPGYAAYGQAPAVRQGTHFDQASGLVLPDGVELASAGRRVGAAFLAIPLVVVTLGIGYLVWGLLIWGKGQTPALQVLGMRCWRPDDQQVPGFWWMALREVGGRAVDGALSIITALVSFIFMFTRPDRRTLHDIIAGTVVLHDPGKVLESR